MSGVFRSAPIQRGFGFGGFLRGILSLLSPITRIFNSGAARSAAKVLKKVARSKVGKAVGSAVKKQFVRSAGNVINDVVAGKNLKQSLKQNGKDSLKRVSQQSLKHLNRQLKNKKGTIFD